MITLEEFMEIFKLKEQGFTISAISRETGLDRKTVRKYLKQGKSKPPQMKERKRRISKLDACQGGYTAYFTTFQNLMETLRKAGQQNRLLRKLQTFNKPHVLIIDELGYLPLDRNDANLFFQLVSNRDESCSIILTSNKTYLDWGNLFPDEGIAAAILDRLLHYSKTIKIQGQSYRLAMKRKMGLFVKT